MDKSATTIQWTPDDAVDRYEVANRLKCSISHVYRLYKSGHLVPHHYNGNRPIFLWSEVLTVMAKPFSPRTAKPGRKPKASDVALHPPLSMTRAPRPTTLPPGQ